MIETVYDVSRPSNPLALQHLLDGYSIEATPDQIAAADDLASLLPSGTSVYIPFLPGSGFANSARATDLVRRAGMRPVPHIAARSISSRTDLERGLRMLGGAGANALLLIAGDAANPAGPYTSTLDLLETGLLESHGFRQIGFAAHPEGHPVVDVATLDNALRLKKAYSEETGSDIWLVSQFTFAADPIVGWLDRMALMDIDIPVRVGVPGPAKMRALLSFAVKCGIATSARALMRRPEAARLLLGRWTPAELLSGLAAYREFDRNPLLAGIHVFGFGGLRTSADWFNAHINFDGQIAH